MGQWSQGGMLMIGDMFNNALEVPGRPARATSCRRWCAVKAGRCPRPRSRNGRAPARRATRARAAARPPASACSSPAPAVPATGGRPSSARPLRSVPRTTSATPASLRPTGWRSSSAALRSRCSTPRPPDHRLLPAAGRRHILDLHQSARAGAGGRPAASSGRRARQHPWSAPPPAEAPTPAVTAAPASQPPAAGSATDDEIFSRIERLAELKQKGILTEEEFAAKKGELLARL